MPNLGNTPLASSRRSALAALAATLEEIERRRARRRLMRYEPYPAQAGFHAAGAGFLERLLRAGNQLGKTVAGGAEAAFHLT
ncbi:MAG: DNA packaging protein, partial [Inquilinus sp.]|nr:DNA packaging protein [Inquilinus sp.]